MNATGIAVDRPNHLDAPEAPPARDRRPATATGTPSGAGAVGALWLACCVLLAAGRSGDLSTTVFAGVALAWLTLPVVVAGLADVRPDQQLVRASGLWAVVQTGIGATAMTVSSPPRFATARPIPDALLAVPVMLLPAWFIVIARRWRPRRRSRHRRVGRSPGGGRRLARVLLTGALAFAIGLAVSLIGAITWSDQAQVFAALSATLTAGLAGTWWITHRGRPDPRALWMGGWLLVGFVAADLAVGPLGPVALGLQSPGYFALVVWLGLPLTGAEMSTRI